jgi:hypothetical protein
MAKFRKSTPSSSPSSALPLDDDVRWRSIDEALDRRIERVRHGEIAVRELQDALEQDRLPCMMVSTATGKRTRLKHTVWTERLMLWLGKDGLRVMLRPQPRERTEEVIASGWRPVLSVRGLHFYIWQPTFETIWPAAVPATAQARLAEKEAAPPADQSSTPPAPKIKPQAWFASALTAHPKQRGEQPIDYARRLSLLMQAATLTKPWKFETLRRRLDDKPDDKPAKPAPKALPPPATR